MVGPGLDAAALAKQLAGGEGTLPMVISSSSSKSYISEKKQSSHKNPLLQILVLYTGKYIQYYLM
jgi:hypothetical protein